ncbi:hypothetical protein FB451DRAFT_477678 [Mycena latifolia]|nr:hypothetical protein FB451DRAFT_477678 [Mycena latifolia]
MDSLHFAPSPYTDDNAPRTPSPPSLPHMQHPQNYKHELDPVRIFSTDDDQYQWAHPAQQQSTHFPPPRPSLLQELYEGDGLSPEHSSPPDMYVDQDWPAPQQQQQQQQHQHQQQRPVDYPLMRRATFPYARQERPEDLAAYPPFLHHDTMYADAHHAHAHHAPHHMPLSAEPSALHGDGGYSPPGYAHGGEFDPAVKLEEAHHHIPHPTHAHHYPPPPPHHHQQHPHQQHPHAQQFYRPHPAHGLHFAPHGLPVQHTDDAASKETQYLRRRCFNCHTTEPPSWRRSTLHPGKIVCNKCGLYERTHLRARPLRFDELRAGNKARKGAKGQGSPKGVAKRAGGGSGARRSSVSSNGSSAQSGSGASDWDDSVSVYSSNGSAPPTSFNSPAFSPHPPPSLTLSSHNSSHGGSPHSHHERDSLSRSPPHSAGATGIRIPHAPDMPALLPAPGLAQRGTKPRSNTTGGLGLGAGGYYSAPSSNGNGYPALHHSSSSSSLHGLHHSSSNSSLHSLHQQQGSPQVETLQLHDGEVYRRGSVGEGARWGGLGMGEDSMGGGISVKEEPRALVV